VTTENAKPYWRHEWQVAIETDFYSRADVAGQELFPGWQKWPLPDDVFPPDESIHNQEFPQDDGLYLHDPIENELYWFASTPADSVEDFLLGAVQVPDDIELFDDVPLEETFTLAPIPDDVVDQSGETILAIPDDIELYEEIPLEETWTQAPLSDDLVDGVGYEIGAFLDAEPEPDPDGHVDFQIPDDVVDQSGQTITSIPDDIELFDETPLEETAVAWEPPGDVEDPPFGLRELPDDIELFDEVPLEETWLASPLADDVVDQSGETILATPDDIELYEEIPLEETWLASPLSDDVQEPSGQELRSIPNDIELYSETPLEETWTLAPTPGDVEEPTVGDQEIPDDIELYGEVPLEETWTQAPQADSVEDFLLGARWIPEDIELFAHVPLELTWTLGPTPDDVEEPTVGDQEVPEDIELFDHIPLELTWTAGPISDDRPEDPGLGVAEWPTDMSDYEEDRESEIPLVFFAPLPDDFHECVHVVVAVEPVVKGDSVIPFTVTVTKGASFTDADFLPMATIYKRTTVGPLTLHASPALVKRPATSGLYDGIFATSVIAAGGAPDLYIAYADVKVGVDFCRWSSLTMAIGPCA
jgi:hypothetical protein